MDNRKRRTCVACGKHTTLDKVDKTLKKGWVCKECQQPDSEFYNEWQEAIKMRDKILSFKYLGKMYPLKQDPKKTAICNLCKRRRKIEYLDRHDFGEWGYWSCKEPCLNNEEYEDYAKELKEAHDIYNKLRNFKSKITLRALT